MSGNTNREIHIGQYNSGNANRGITHKNSKSGITNRQVQIGQYKSEKYTSGNTNRKYNLKHTNLENSNLKIKIG